MRRISVFVPVVALAFVWPLPALGGGRAALAQDATPAAQAFPMTPDPAECTVEPRPVEEFVAIAAAATPVAAAAARRETVEVPVGPLADADTVAGVTATVREVFACFNAGDIRRAFSLLTDEAIRGFAEEDPIPAEELRGFLGATPAAVPAAGRSTILAVTDVVLLADGRVGALVASTDPLAEEEETTTVHLTFERADGRWLVDDFVEFHTHPEEAGEATPAP